MAAQNNRLNAESEFGAKLSSSCLRGKLESAFHQGGKSVSLLVQPGYRLDSSRCRATPIQR